MSMVLRYISHNSMNYFKKFFRFINSDSYTFWNYSSSTSNFFLFSTRFFTVASTELEIAGRADHICRSETVSRGGAYELVRWGAKTKRGYFFTNQTLRDRRDLILCLPRNRIFLQGLASQHFWSSRYDFVEINFASFENFNPMTRLLSSKPHNCFAVLTRKWQCAGRKC